MSRQIVEGEFPVKIQTVVADGLHNAFTDLIYWHDAFWLIYVASPSHFASSKSQLVLQRSTDAEVWKEVTRFSGNGLDIRDPKLAVLNDHMVLYALLNKCFDPMPYQTVYAQSEDGIKWSSFNNVDPIGWLLGKPKSYDSINWFVPAHNLKLGEARLLHSIDGIHWKPQLAIENQRKADETALAFTPDGTLVTVTRIESKSGIFGGLDAGTLISTAISPYRTWQSQEMNTLSRIDGPTMIFTDCMLAIGRNQIDLRPPFNLQGSIFGHKRTTIFQIKDMELILLLDLPSCGDTAYGGAVLLKDSLYISYYTNSTAKDPAWISGMFLPTQINIACISQLMIKNTRK